MSAVEKSFPPSAYSLFLRGYDTADIAFQLGKPEHEVVHDLTVERSRAKGRPATFEPSPYASSPVKKWLAGNHPIIGRSGLR
jgi:hypothetical protein